MVTCAIEARSERVGKRDAVVATAENVMTTYPLLCRVFVAALGRFEVPYVDVLYKCLRDGSGSDNAQLYLGIGLNVVACWWGSE